MIAIRFNKSKGAPGRGTVDHAWRIFDGGKEYIAKNVKIQVPSWGQKTEEDWSICCDGVVGVDKETSTVTISSKS